MLRLSTIVAQSWAEAGRFALHFSLSLSSTWIIYTLGLQDLPSVLPVETILTTADRPLPCFEPCCSLF